MRSWLPSRTSLAVVAVLAGAILLGDLPTSGGVPAAIRLTRIEPYGRQPNPQLGSPSELSDMKPDRLYTGGIR